MYFSMLARYLSVLVGKLTLANNNHNSIRYFTCSAVILALTVLVGANCLLMIVDFIFELLWLSERLLV